MIDHDRKFIFVHIRKTAGSTLTKVLGGDDVAVDKHMSPAGYVAEYGRKVWDEYFTFCVVRNPWEVAVSDYHFSRKRAQTVGLDKATRKGKAACKLEFSPWVERFSLGLYSVLRGPESRTFDFEGDSLIVEGASYPFNDFLRFESLREDLERIDHLLPAGWRDLLATTWRNRVERAHYTEYYTTERARQVVEESCAPIIRKFGYEFG